jgi:Inositol polyphosphate kinase
MFRSRSNFEKGVGSGADDDGGGYAAVGDAAADRRRVERVASAPIQVTLEGEGAVEGDREYRAAWTGASRQPANFGTTFGRGWLRLRGGTHQHHGGSAAAVGATARVESSIEGFITTAAGADDDKVDVGDAPTAAGLEPLPPRHAARAIPLAFVDFKPLAEVEADSDGRYTQQAGGHPGSFQSAGAILYKRAGERERQFYAHAAEKAPWMSLFLPTYYPDLDLKNGTIPLENLVHSMHYPCVLDLKLGTSTVEDDETSLRKRVRMGALDHVTTTKSDGVRLEGMSMFRVLEHAYVRTSKLQSHAISASIGNTLSDVLSFFLTDESGFRTDIALRFYSNLEVLLQRFLDENRSYRFIGSSILLIYDNDNQAPYSRWARAIEANTKLGRNDLYRLRRRTRLAVRVVDFAHIGPLPPGQQRDEGFVTGLNSILNALRSIITAEKRGIFTLEDAIRDAEEHAAGLGATARSTVRDESATVLDQPLAAAHLDLAPFKVMDSAS